MIPFKQLITSLAAACVAAGSASAAPESPAQELLHTAQATAERLTSCPSTADDLVGAATLRILQRHPEAFETSAGKAWEAYVRQSIRNAFRDDLRRRSWTRFGSDLAGEDAESGSFEDSLPATGVEDATEVLAVEEFRTDLEAHERDVLDQLLAGKCEREIARELERTRHDVRASLKSIRHAAEVTFRPAD